MFAANLIIKLSIMLKNILNLNGAQKLSKSQQGTINGGGPIGQTFCTNPWQGAYATSGECESVCVASGAQCAQVIDGGQTCWVCVGPNMK